MSLDTLKNTVMTAFALYEFEEQRRHDKTAELMQTVERQAAEIATLKEREKELVATIERLLPMESTSGSAKNRPPSNRSVLHG